MWLAWRVAPAGGVRGGGVAGLGLFAFLCQIHMAARKLGETFSIQSCGCLAVLGYSQEIVLLDTCFRYHHYPLTSVGLTMVPSYRTSSIVPCYAYGRNCLSEPGEEATCLADDPAATAYYFGGGTRNLTPSGARCKSRDLCHGVAMTWSLGVVSQ